MRQGEDTTVRALIDLATAVVGVVGMAVILDAQQGNWHAKAVRYWWEHEGRSRLTWALLRWGIISPAAIVDKMLEELNADE